MNTFLHSPFAIGVCLLALFAWVTMLLATFWPRKGHEWDDHHDARF